VVQTGGGLKKETNQIETHVWQSSFDPLAVVRPSPSRL